MSIIDINYFNDNKGIYAALMEHNNIVYGYWLGGQNYKHKNTYYGSYPVNYLKRIRLMFPNYEQYKVLHVFSGVVEKEPNEITIDINGELNPDIVGNAEELSSLFNVGDVQIILADPPYEKTDSEKYGCKHPRKKVVIRECSKILKSGGILVWLDTRIPMWAKKDGWKLRGTIGFNQSTNHRTRTITILEKV